MQKYSADNISDDNIINGKTLLIDKPLNWTSFDAVKYIRRSLTSKFKIKKIKVNFEVIDKCNDYNFVDQITMICPFAFEEKQLLLETISISKRGNLLNSIIESYASEENISKVVKH